MQQQIASYLFQHKTCSLPGLGTLTVHWSGAKGDFLNRLITAPKPTISFTAVESDYTGFINYLTRKWSADATEISAGLNSLCQNLKKQILAGDSARLPGIGDFSLDVSGKIEFRPEELPATFIQPVVAERVSHPDAEHHILVGDKETTNTVMTEFLSPKEMVRDRWWIWAVVLGAAVLLLLLIYFTELKGGAPFGNTIKI